MASIDALDRLRAQDSAARAAAQEEFSLPVVVGAGAGTGKTTILVARIVTWCVGPGWERGRAELGADASVSEVAADVVAGVVAITFTEAAAAEMAGRVGGALARIGAGEVPTGVYEDHLPGEDSRARRSRALLGELHRLRVRTIHSFCQWMLQSFPIEAGLDPEFTVDGDGLAVEEVVHEVVGEATREALTATPDPDWLSLVEAGLGPFDLAETLVTLEGERVEPSLLEQDPLSEAVVAKLRADTVSVLDSFWEVEGGRLLEAKKARRTVQTRFELAELTRQLHGPVGVEDHAGHLAALAKCLSSKSVARIRDWGRGKLVKAEGTALAEAAQQVAGAAERVHGCLVTLSELRPELLGAARRVVAPLLGRVREELRARGVVTFQGLLTGARDLLQRHPWVRAQLRRGVRQLLVDEFQDTDSIQCDIVRCLALEGAAEERPGLFIVGDPKQSIYGWRDADLAAYEAFVDSVRQRNGLVFELCVNYRSVPPILDEVARVVAPVMEEEKGVQPPFELLLPCDHNEQEAGFDREPWGPVEHWLSWPESAETGELGPGSSAEATGVEARALARDLVALHEDEGVPWGEVGVLLRSTSDLDLVLRELRQAGVPYAVTRDREYFRRREIVQVAALVRCVLDPADQLALLTVLRSDVVGVPDAALNPLWRHGYAGAMMLADGAEGDSIESARDAVRRAAADLPKRVPGLDRLSHWEESLLWATETIAALRRSFAVDPPDVFVEAARSMMLPEATAATRYLGHHRRARMEGFFAELERLLLEDEGQRSEVARFLRRAVERGQESREPVALESASDSVQVMTIHGAKGLDFEHVYVLQLHKRTRGPAVAPKTRVLRGADGGTEYCLLGWRTPGFVAAERRAERRERAERVRLLYVAMTRARRRLVVAGQWPEQPGVVDPMRAGSMMDLVAHRGVQQDVIGWARSGTPRVHLDGALWVLAANALPEARSACKPRAGETAAAAEVRGDAELLHRARRISRERMDRPMGGAASREGHRPPGVCDREEGAGTEVVAPTPQVATAVGSAVHRALELLNLDGDLEAQVERVSREELHRVLAPEHQQEALDRMTSVLEAMAGGRCLDRLAEIRDHVVARELAAVMPPEADTGPVGFLAARVDLVYSDPEDGTLVVADYKTDLVSGASAARQRAESYRGQLELYARAVEEGLRLTSPPAMELWFLAADCIVRL